MPPLGRGGQLGAAGARRRVDATEGGGPALADETPLEETALPSVLLSDDFLQNAAAKEHEYLLSLHAGTFLYEV